MVKKRETNGDATPKKTRISAGGEPPAKRPVRRAAAARPRLKASHVEAVEGSRATLPAKKSGAAGSRGTSAVRKTPLSGPRRAGPRRAVAPEAPPEPSAVTRELALALAAAGIEKKALGIEILDVSGKVDYADFLVIMTGRSDRHVHAIATGLEEALRLKKVRPLSMEGLQASSWVLIDFGDVVVHVFQEDARRLYDIEGLWIDAGRVDVPAPMSGAAGGESKAVAPSTDFDG